MAETSISHAPRHSDVFPCPKAVERRKQRQYREARKLKEAERKEPREAMRARVVNWAIWKSGERRTIRELTGLIPRSIGPTEQAEEIPTANDVDAVLLDKAIERLPMLIYNIVNYKFLQGWENHDIADVLHMHRNTVTNKINLALDNLCDLVNSC